MPECYFLILDSGTEAEGARGRSSLPPDIMSDAFNDNLDHFDQRYPFNLQLHEHLH